MWFTCYIWQLFLYCVNKGICRRLTERGFRQTPVFDSQEEL